MLWDNLDKLLVQHVLSYMAAISASAKGEQWQKELAMLWDNLDKLLVQHVLSYMAAISASAKGEQWQKELAMLWDNLDKLLVQPVICYFQCLRHIPPTQSVLSNVSLSFAQVAAHIIMFSSSCPCVLLRICRCRC